MAALAYAYSMDYNGFLITSKILSKVLIDIYFHLFDYQ